jgi:hypothetical protein
MPLSIPANASGISDPNPAEGGESQIPSRIQHRESDEHTPPSPRVSSQADDDGGERRSGQANADEEADLRGGETDLREMDRQRHADEAHRRRADEGSRVDQPGVACH